MDRLTAIQVFVDVAECGSLTQAAERREISPAMVSRALAGLEKWFGARLMHRTTRRVSLTQAGNVALPHCKKMLEIAEDVRHMSSQLATEPIGLLRVTTSVSFADAQLVQAVAAFQEIYPKVEIDLIVGDRAADLVVDRIDLAIRITNTLDPTMITRRLATCRSLLCASPAYIARHGTPTSLEELHAHRCIGHTFGLGDSYRFVRDDQQIEVPFRWNFNTSETVVLRRSALAGQGIAMLPTYYINDDLRAGRLAAVALDCEPEQLGVHAVYLSREHQQLSLRLLVDFLASRFSGPEAPWDAMPSTQ